MMKIQIAKSNLKPALASCCTVVESKSATPIAACVLLETMLGTVRMRSTNYYQTIERTAPLLAMVTPGSMLLDASALLKRIDALDDGEITIAETKGGVDIRQGSAKYTLGKIDIEQAPKIESVEPCGGEVDARAFGALLIRLEPAMYDSDASPHTHAVDVTTAGGKLVMMATDSHVAAIGSLTFDGDLSVLIPAPAVKQLCKVLAKIDGVARVAVVGNRFHVFAPGFAYSTAIAAGQFPPVRSIMPARQGNGLTVNRVEMLSAIKAVEVVGPANDRVHIRPSVGGFTLRGTSKEGESASREVGGKCDIQSSISSKYLAEMIDFMGGDEVSLWQGQGKRAIDLPPDGMVSENADGDLFVVMPLRYDAEDLSTDAVKD